MINYRTLFELLSKKLAIDTATTKRSGVQVYNISHEDKLTHKSMFFLYQAMQQRI